jgi:hypothetical protein
MYGAYCATKLYRLAPGKRILVLEVGPFLVSEHIQNLARIGLNVPTPIPPASDPGVARELVWGLAWRGNVDFLGLAYCLGGKSLYWGAGARASPARTSRAGRRRRPGPSPIIIRVSKQKLA